MKTNLIFKKQELIDGVTKVVTKIIPVEVPHIKSGEGWILSGHADIIDIVSEETTVQEKPKDAPVKEVTGDIVKFQSNIPGTAKLVRSRNTIKIVARRGKSTYNETTPNSVCISDKIKNDFFSDCRKVHGNVGLYEFSPKDGGIYDLWNESIDHMYVEQKLTYLKSQENKA